MLAYLQKKIEFEMIFTKAKTDHYFLLFGFGRSKYSYII